MGCGRTLVLGIGNTIIGNDAIGIMAVRALRKEELSADCLIAETQETGINLLAAICGYAKVIIVDSIRTLKNKPGYIHRFTQDDFKAGRSIYSSHQLGLPTLLEIGRELKLDIPGQMIIYAVEIDKEECFRETLTKPVEKSVSKLVGLIQEELLKNSKEEV